VGSVPNKNENFWAYGLAVITSAFTARNNPQRWQIKKGRYLQRAENIYHPASGQKPVTLKVSQATSLDDIASHLASKSRWLFGNVQKLFCSPLRGVSRRKAPGPVPVSLIYGMLLHLQEEQSVPIVFFPWKL